MTSTLTADRAQALAPAARTLFVLLVVSQIGVLTFLLWEPPFDGSIRYDDVAPIADAYWPMNVLLGGPSFALGTVALSIFLAVLGAGRTSSLVGVVLHLLGGLVFALAITAEVLPYAWALDPAVVDESQGRMLFEAYDDRLDAFLPYVLVPMAAVAIGALVAVVAAARAGTLSWWVVGATVLVAITAFVVPAGGALSVVTQVAQHALFVWIGWCGLRSVVARD